MAQQNFDASAAGGAPLLPRIVRKTALCHGHDGQQTDCERCLLLCCAGEQADAARPLLMSKNACVADDLTDGEEVESDTSAAVSCFKVGPPASLGTSTAHLRALLCSSRLLRRRGRCCKTGTTLAGFASGMTGPELTKSAFTLSSLQSASTVAGFAASAAVSDDRGWVARQK